MADLGQFKEKTDTRGRLSSSRKSSPREMKPQSDHSSSSSSLITSTCTAVRSSTGITGGAPAVGIFVVDDAPVDARTVNAGGNP